MQLNEASLPGQIGDADLRLLRVFKAVADCGGLAAAERELGLALSTISRHLKDLEQRLGLTLARRGRAGFALTPEGEQLHAAATQLLGATDAFRGQLHEIHRRLAGDLHLAVFEKTASNPDARIAEAVAAFQARAPQATLHMHVGTIAMIERGVIDGSFQLGIVPEHRRSDSLDYTPLFGETMSLYAGRGHPWFTPQRKPPGWDALRREALVGLGYQSPNLMLTHARRLERRATASDQEAVATLVLSGRYLGFLPDHYAEPFVRAGRLRAVSPQVLNYACQFSVVQRRSPAPSRLAAAFHQALVQAHAG